MPETVADVLIRLGVNTTGLREGFRDARSQSLRFANDLAQILTVRGGPLGNLGQLSGNTGGFGSILSAIVSGIGAPFTAIGGLFTRAARNTARDIRRSFQEIVAEFSAGSATLGETIRRLEDNRASAIRRLSGRKGGRKELDKLLPEFDQALAELRARQEAIFEQFDTSLELLRTGEAFRTVAADVREIVGQYRTYVDAGGDLAKANEFLSRSLGEIRKQSEISLAEGEQRAIEDALRLNDLLREREELLAESAEDERRILTRGVLERQHTVAQDKSAELDTIRRRRDERLADLDRDIRLQQLKVDSEGQIFELAADRISLETRLLELKAGEIEREAAYLAALKEVVAGIVPGTSGFLGVAPVLQQQLNLGGVQIVLGQNVTPLQAQRAGEQVIEGMLRLLVRERSRFGLPI